MGQKKKHEQHVRKPCVAVKALLRVGSAKKSSTTLPDGHDQTGRGDDAARLVRREADRGLVVEAVHAVLDDSERRKIAETSEQGRVPTRHNSKQNNEGCAE